MRELENLILRLVVLIDHAVIEAGDIRPILGEAAASSASAEAGGTLYTDARGHIERYFQTHGDALPPAGYTAGS